VAHARCGDQRRAAWLNDRSNSVGLIDRATRRQRRVAFLQDSTSIPSNRRERIASDWLGKISFGRQSRHRDGNGQTGSVKAPTLVLERLRIGELFADGLRDGEDYCRKC
jgi:hypothetical protein